MAFDRDPYRTLGLAHGASLEEVKRAYRRLAKAHHPDAAGGGGIARFLAIQAAYEQLVEGGGPGRTSRPSAGTNRRPSEADADRAEATRRAYGGRPRARRPADDAAAGTGPRAAGESPGRGRAGSTRAGGAGAEAGSGAPGPGGPTGARPGDPESGRRRGKATLGSTSYDDATTGPFEPDWGGASWYGTTSGTYWTINPKEYADPRKHGPEYQARARRATGPRPLSEAAGRRGTGEPVGQRTDGTAAGAPDPSPDPAAPAGPAARAPQADAPLHEPAGWWTSTGETFGPAEPAATSGTDRPGRRPVEPSFADDEVLDPARAVANLARALIDPAAGGLRGRVIRAFVGWLPIALGIGWAVGEITGCSRFAATCDPAVDPLILLAQGAVLAALFLAPSIAALTAGAALGLLVASVAATLVLSATGNAADEASRRATLAALLLLAWLAGLALAVARRVRAASVRAGPVS